MPTIPLRERSSWKALEKHHAEIGGRHLRDLFAEDPQRGERLGAEAAGLYLDYSKNRITDETLQLLFQLARECQLEQGRNMMFAGEPINTSERRSVLHMALRMPKDSSLVVDGVDVVAQVHEVLDRMAAFARRVRSGEWKGYTGKAIRNVINVGIGGSDPGPVMAYEALRHYPRRDLTIRFVSNVDSTDFAEATRDLDADETLFIISSKTFGTLETLTNAHSARDWVIGQLGDERTLNPLGDHHDILSSNVFAQAQALAFGRTGQEVRAEGSAPDVVPHRVMEGNRTTNVLLAEKITPRLLGALVALYEHSVFTQGTIWSIDSLDQWGCRARQGARRSDHSRTDQRNRTRTRPRLVHQRADPPLPHSEGLRGEAGRSPNG